MWHLPGYVVVRLVKLRGVGIRSLERGICSFIPLDIEMVIALIEVQGSCGWRSEGRFSFILRHFKRPLGCGELFGNPGECYFGHWGQMG